MAYTARELVTDSYNMSGVVSVDLQSIQGEQLKRGLGFLNNILAVRRVDDEHIPYYEAREFLTVPGVERYFVEDMITVSTATFEMGGVRYEISLVDRNAFQGTSRVNQLNTLPSRANVERAYDGLYISFWPHPDKVYPIRLYGKVWIDDVTEDTDLSLFFDRFYTTYLMYKLAQYICIYYNKRDINPALITELRTMENLTVDVAPKDLMQRIDTPFVDNGNFGWGGIIFWKGFDP